MPAAACLCLANRGRAPAFHATQGADTLIPRNRTLALRVLFCLTISVASALAPAPCTAQPLHAAVRSGDSAEVRRLLATSADAERRGEDGLTPLIIAALNGHEHIVTQLLAKGVDPNGRDDNGFTALHAAAHTGRAGIVKLLIARGADVNDQDNTSRLTPLHASAERDHRDVALLLLQAGADLNRVLDNGHTPIVRATLKGHPAMVKLLREHGANCTHIKHPEFRDYCMSAGN